MTAGNPQTDRIEPCGLLPDDRDRPIEIDAESRGIDGEEFLACEWRWELPLIGCRAEERQGPHPRLRVVPLLDGAGGGGELVEVGFAGEAGKGESASGDGDGDAERHGQEHDDDRPGERSDASDDELGEGESEEHAGVVDR